MLKEDIDFYFDEHGLMVLTKKYLLARGYCCGNGCRHCPFSYKAVPEPKRSQLLKDHAMLFEPQRRDGTKAHEE